MKIEDQVCSLENAKKLAELGVVRESLFFWELNKANKYFPGRVTFGDPSVDNSWSIPYPAYTVAELGRMLPRAYTMQNPYLPKLWICKSCFDWDWHTENEDNEADARAKMLIYLLEKGHIDVKELNR